jgi:two-component system response regulator MprA
MVIARVLLLGSEAEALAARLEASGYAVQCGLQPAAITTAAAAKEAGAEAAPTAAPAPLQLAVLAAGAVGRIAELRRQLPGVPILLDVGDDSLEGRVHCLSTGADDFWLSSLGPSDLLMRVRLQLDLRRRRMPPSPLLQIADLSLNPGNHEVKRGKRPVALTAREYQLLLLLLERQGTVVSREQIQRLVWNDDRGASSNVIEVYVRYLRQKLEEGGERRLIHTIRGRGYCLSERMPPLEAP